MNLYSGLLLLGALNAAAAVPLDCKVPQANGNVKIVREGESMSYVGMACINSTSFEAVNFVCKSGDIEDFDDILTCPAATPKCVQCGAKSYGAALCLTTVDVPAYCDNLDLSGEAKVIQAVKNGAEPLTLVAAITDDRRKPKPMLIDSKPPLHGDPVPPNIYNGDNGVALVNSVGIDALADPTLVADVPRNKRGKGGSPCLDRDLTFPDGAAIKYVGTKCLNSTHFDAVEFFCSNGTVNDMDTVMECPVFDAPYCVQCGAPSFGAAMCLPTPDVPDFCDNFNLTALPPPVKSVKKTTTGVTPSPTTAKAAKRMKHKKVETTTRARHLLKGEPNPTKHVRGSTR